MIVESILALAALNLPTVPPELLRPFASHEQCMVEAEKMNKTVEELRTPPAREAGYEFICLKVSRVLI